MCGGTQRSGRRERGGWSCVTVRRQQHLRSFIVTNVGDASDQLPPTPIVPISDIDRCDWETGGLWERGLQLSSVPMRSVCTLWRMMRPY